MEFDLTMLYLSKSYVVVPNLKLYHMPFIWIKIIIIIIIIIDPKNLHLVEDFKIVLPVKFGWILFSGFRGEVENVKS